MKRIHAQELLHFQLMFRNWLKGNEKKMQHAWKKKFTRI